MAKNKTLEKKELANAQAIEELTSAQGIAFDPQAVVDGIIEGVNAVTVPLKSEKLAGIESNVYSYVTTIEKDGKTEIVTHTIRNPLAVKVFSLLDKLVYLEGQSAKLTALSMSKLTKAHAEAIGKKTVKELILDRFPNYDGNTIDRYRKLGLLFAADRTDPNNFEWCEGIPQETSVTNLDTMIRVLNLAERKGKDGKKISIEKLSDSELEELRNEVLHYIILDRLHPLATLQTIRNEVKAIQDEEKSILTTGKVIDEEGEGEGTGEGEGKKIAEVVEKATHAINTLSELFPNNEVIKNAILVILDEVNNITGNI